MGYCPGFLICRLSVGAGNGNPLGTLSVSRIEQMKVLCKKPFGDFVDPKGDEEGGKDVNRIVEMTEQDDNAEEERRCQKYPAQNFFIPENESHEERKSGMSGKEEVSRECEGIEYKISAFQGRLMHRWPHMREYNEKRTNDKKYAETFQYERGSPGAQCQQTGHKNEKSHNAIHEYPIDIYCGNVIENKVVNRIAHVGGRVSAGHIIDYKAGSKESNPPQYGYKEFFAGPVMTTYN